MPVSGFSAPSALYAPFTPAVPVSGSSTPSVPSAPMSGSSTLSTLSVLVVSISESFAPSALSTPSVLFMSALSVFGSFAPSTPSVLSAPTVPVFEFSTLSALSVPFIPFPHIPTLGRQRLIELNRKKMRAASKELAPVYTFQISSNQLSFSPLLSLFSSVLFPFICIGKKRLFDKAFDINSRLLARDHTRKELDLSFADCHCPAAVKANRVWQRKLLNSKLVYMVETIPLAVAIFWDPNFLPCTRHILNLAKKLGLKMKNLRADIIKKQIG